MSIFTYTGCLWLELFIDYSVYTIRNSHVYMFFYINYYGPHPKDGEGNVFSLSTPGGGVPISHNALQHFPECHGAAGGVPCQVQPGGVPCQVQLGGGCTLRGGIPWPGGVGGTLPGGGTQLGQQKEYSLQGGRYASCVHAGGLSC